MDIFMLLGACILYISQLKPHIFSTPTLILAVIIVLSLVKLIFHAIHKMNYELRTSSLIDVVVITLTFLLPDYTYLFFIQMVAIFRLIALMYYSYFGHKYTKLICEVLGVKLIVKHF